MARSAGVPAPPKRLPPPLAESLSCPTWKASKFAGNVKGVVTPSRSRTGGIGSTEVPRLSRVARWFRAALVRATSVCGPTQRKHTADDHRDGEQERHEGLRRWLQ